MRQRRSIAVHGVCRNRSGQVLFARSDGAWELPGGRVAQGEHPNNALVRGFGDETGLVARVVGLRDVTFDLAVQSAEVVHTDRILYEVRVPDRPLRDGAVWADPATLPLVPFTARLLGQPASVETDVPPAQPFRDPAATMMQRFAAYGLTTDPAGRVLLTRIAPGYPGADSWHLPGGGTDFGERADTGLLRELVEETAQHGRVTGLLEVTHYHNPRALGPEGHPMDWHTVRALYRVVVDRPGVPSVVEAAGGSTAEAAWFDRADLGKAALNEFARRAFAHHLD
jgi:8-oxo-dGTP diphosphatase